VSAWKQDPDKKIRSAEYHATVSVVVSGVVTAVLLLLFSTYSHTPEKARFVLWIPSMFIHSKLVSCAESCSAEREPNFALLFGSFFLLYFMVGAGIAAGVIALRRRIGKAGK